MFNPRWMFHATIGSQVIHTQEQLDALGFGWADSPAAAEAFRAEPVAPVSQEQLEADHLARIKAEANEAQEVASAKQSAENIATAQGTDTPAVQLTAQETAEAEVAAEIAAIIAKS